MEFLWQELPNATNIIMHMVDCSTEFSEEKIKTSRDLIIIRENLRIYEQISTAL